jgi:PAS domain S-box-containing protein
MEQNERPNPQEVKSLVLDLQVELERRKEELRQTEEKLAHSQRRYAEFFDSAPIGCFVLNRDGVILETNFTGASMLGRAKHSILFLPFAQLTVTEDREIFFRHLKEVFERGAIQCEEVRLKREDQSIFHAQLQSSALEEQPGEPACCRMAVVDISERKPALLFNNITERKRAEERERELAGRALAATAKFQSVFNQSGIFAGIMDLEGTVREANELSLKTCGYRAEEVIGLLLWETPWWRFSEEVKAKLRQATDCVADGVVYRAILPYWWADGTERLVDFAMHPIRDEAGRVMFLHPTGIDITERQRAEEALRHRSQQFMTLINQAPLGMYLVDADFRLAQVNPIGLPVFGNLPNLIGRDFGEILRAMWPREKAEEIVRIFRHTLETSEPFHYPEFAEHRADRGVTEYYDWRVVRIPLPDGRYGVVCYFRDISEQVRARRAIAESEERYRALFNSIDEGFCIIEVVFAAGKPVDWRYLEINPAFERQSGLRDALGKTIRELLPGLEPFWLAIYGKVALTGEPTRYEDHVKPMGRWFDVYAFRVGKPHERKVAVLFNDITERKRSEEQLRQSESFYRQTLESIPGMVFTTRPDGYCDYQSQQWVDYTGIPMSEHVGDGWNKLLHPEDQPRAFEAWRAAVEERAPYDLEYRVRRRDGEYEWFKVIARPIRDAAGRMARWFGVAINIEALKRAQEALRASGERLQAALTGSGAGTFRWNLQTHALEWDENLDRLFGLPPGQTIRSLDNFIATVHPEERPDVIQRRECCAREGADLEMEFRVIWPDGSIHWLYDKGKTFRDAGGEPSYMAGACVDITERKAAELALAEAQAKLEQHAVHLEKMVAERTERLRETIAELEHFSYTITHDMRAPLRAMQAFGQILREEYYSRLDELGADYLRRIIESSQRMDSLITDSLNYAKTVQTELALEPIDPGKLLRGMVESYPQFQPPRAEIELSESFPLVLANQAGLTQCFSNLLTNAVKFVKPGRAPHVRVWAEQKDDMVRLWFQDNGIGIPPDQQERLFVLFRRLSKEYEGTGVGLALVRKVIEKMRGKVGLESNPGQGSLFWVDLERVDQRP